MIIVIRTMFKIAHATDIHLPNATIPKIEEFADSVDILKPDVLIISGDIAESQASERYLYLLGLLFPKLPVYFVNGNHDYYNSSVAAVRERMTQNYTAPEASKFSPGLWYLGSSGVIPLTRTDALCGHDGWYDWNYAIGFTSRVDMQDFHCIRELTDAACSCSKNLRYYALQILARESAEYVRTQMLASFAAGFTTIHVVTHVPPFRENSVNNGKISDDDWLPHFSSKIMGDMLLEVMTSNPDKKCVAYCGHSHGEAHFQALPNLICHTGPARYGFPAISGVYEI